jgi:hypothetical protein
MSVADSCIAKAATPGGHMIRESHVQRHGEYEYTVNVEEIPSQVTGDRFAAKAVHFEHQMATGRSERLTVEFGEEYGATTQEASERVQAAADRWIDQQI